MEAGVGGREAHRLALARELILAVAWWGDGALTGDVRQALGQGWRLSQGPDIKEREGAKASSDEASSISPADNDALALLMPVLLTIYSGEGFVQVRGLGGALVVV